MNDPTSVSELGERPLISRLSGVFGSVHNPDVPLGAGPDDCAVIDISEDEYMVITTDMLHRKTDFPLCMTPWQIGWMSAAVNFSDVASMGARPIGFLSAMGFSKDTDLSFVDEVSRGMNDCARFCGTSVIGGDIDTHDELTITGTCLGKVKKSELLTRRGAKPGDIVCVTGFAGSAGAALHALENDIDIPDSLLNTLLEPVPRVSEAQKLALTGAVTSMMDTSDGLAMSLHDLADLNNVGFRIDEDSLPIQKEIEDHVTSESSELTDFALYTGGDFELLFTVSPDMLEVAQTACYLNVIGNVVDREVGTILRCHSGKNLTINRKGYLQLGN
ncbi:thiamine-phosphate kinase [Methanolobus bombayensis]|uniref:thiamine-phosphate kinase n=1 Tax=Methanolobus bombayensis TaxID=38023 RepID=UPI001AE4875B|nr:thiamine-phosphate kinase [Methanolobus bombayensis]MBP1908102.1 thiamine-monophosphate kinase [Methanolobus bombayensis]